MQRQISIFYLQLVYSLSNYSGNDLNIISLRVVRFRGRQGELLHQRKVTWCRRNANSLKPEWEFFLHQDKALRQQCKSIRSIRKEKNERICKTSGRNSRVYSLWCYYNFRWWQQKTYWNAGFIKIYKQSKKSDFKRKHLKSLFSFANDNANSEFIQKIQTFYTSPFKWFYSNLLTIFALYFYFI